MLRNYFKNRIKPPGSDDNAKELYYNVLRNWGRKKKKGGKRWLNRLDWLIWGILGYSVVHQAFINWRESSGVIDFIVSLIAILTIEGLVLILYHSWRGQEMEPKQERVSRYGIIGGLIVIGVGLLSETGVIPVWLYTDWMLPMVVPCVFYFVYAFFRASDIDKSKRQLKQERELTAIASERLEVNNLKMKNEFLSHRMHMERQDMRATFTIMRRIGLGRNRLRKSEKKRRARALKGLDGLALLNDNKMTNLLPQSGDSVGAEIGDVELEVVPPKVRELTCASCGTKFYQEGAGRPANHCPECNKGGGKKQRLHRQRKKK